MNDILKAGTALDPTEIRPGMKLRIEHEDHFDTHDCIVVYVFVAETVALPVHDKADDFDYEVTPEGSDTTFGLNDDWRILLAADFDGPRDDLEDAILDEIGDFLNTFELDDEEWLLEHSRRELSRRIYNRLVLDGAF